MLLRILFSIFLFAGAYAQQKQESQVPAEPTNTGPINLNPVTTAADISDESDVNSTIDHDVIRRVAVLPFYYNTEYKKEADLAWWRVREFLSEQQRFLVATKRFLQQNEIFQPRKNLSISDVVLLSKILESDCIITSYINDKKIFMSAYSGTDGSLLWKQQLEISAAQPVRMQLEELSLKLVKDFISHFPYQGFQIVDPISNSALIEDGQTILARVDVGAKSTATVGQKVQWIELSRVSPAPLFSGGGQVKVIAEGMILKNENQVLTVEVKRAKDVKLLEKKALIAIPDEQIKIKNSYAIKSSGAIQVNAYLVNEPMADPKTKNSESRPLLVALASIANIVAAILLAL